MTKVPRFAFEKFPGSNSELTTHMKSVGEAMAIGRTFRESFAKAMRSRELDEPADIPEDTDDLLERLETPSADRFDLIAEAFRREVSPEEVNRRTHVDMWFLRELDVAGAARATAPRASSALSRPLTLAQPSSRRARPTSTPRTSARPMRSAARSAGHQTTPS